MQASTSSLRTLDDALTGLRRVWLHPERRRRFLAELGEPVELAALRTLRAVELAVGAEEAEPGISDVAAALTVDRSTASRLVEQAVAAGYIARASSEDDRRRALLRLTPEGARLLARATEVRARLLAEVTSDWPADDVETLADLLTRLQHDFERLDE